MYNSRLFAIVFVLSALNGGTQPTFMTAFRATGTGKANLIELNSGNLFVGMARGSGVSLADTGGDILYSHVYAVDTLLAIRSVKRYSDNEFFFTATYWKDNCSGTTITYPALGRIDSLGNLLSLRYYALNSTLCSNRAGNLEVLSDASAVVWGEDRRLFILKVEPSGGVAWAKRFSTDGGFLFVKELPGGDLLAGMSLDTAGAVVARLDADGNFLWCKSYIRPKGVVHDAVIESDDSFIITGYTDSTQTDLFTPLPNTFQPKLFMMKLNGDGEVLWCRGYDSDPYDWNTPIASKITRTLDGNYAVLATLGRPGYNQFYRPFLMKTDQNGDTLWTRSVGASGYEYQTQSLLAYSDGGLIFNGRIWGEMPDSQLNWAFLYKADSMGHLPCSEQWHSVDVLELFPVDSSFTLSSVDGALALPAFVNDENYNPLVVYDGCTFTTSVPSSQGRIWRKATIRPNPTPGRFTVEFQDPLMKDSYYSVYDAMGKLLFQRAAAHGKKTEDLDLTGYAQGTYVIRFTDGDGVCYERVVLE